MTGFTVPMFRDPLFTPNPANNFYPENVICIFSNASQSIFNHGSKLYEPRPDSSIGTAPSLVWVHIVCNVSYQSKKAYERADDSFVLNGRKSFKSTIS